jgi:hypothetical protein
VTAPKEPRTAAGRALRKLAIDADDLDLTKYILAIEAEALAATPPASAELREAAQAFVDATEDPRIWAVLIADGTSPVRFVLSGALIDTMRDARNAVRAALAATPPASAERDAVVEAAKGWAQFEHREQNDGYRGGRPYSTLPTRHDALLEAVDALREAER